VEAIEGASLRDDEGRWTVNAARSGGDGYRGVVWLDRDGTLVDDPGYLDDPGKLRLLEGAAEAVARLNRAKWAVVLVTNQSGIGRGLMSRATVDRIHGALRERLRAVGAHLDGVYLCPHLPAELLPEGEAACDCRKPRPGLVLKARKELGLEDLPSVVVGDKAADVELARRVGAAAVLVLTGEGRRTLESWKGREKGPDHVSGSLGEAVDWILDPATGSSGRGG